MSPALFTLFVNIAIGKMRELYAGCCLNGTYIGCIMYADDFVVLSASGSGLQSLLDCCYQVRITLMFKFNCLKSSVSGLQTLLDCCYQVYITLMLKFNCLKSSCSVVDPACKLNISKMRLGSVSIEWTSSFKYLGVVFNAGCKLSVDTNAIKRKFYTACFI